MTVVLFISEAPGTPWGTRTRTVRTASRSLPLSASLQTPEYVLVSSNRTWMSLTCATVRLNREEAEEEEEELCEIMARMRMSIRLKGGRGSGISDDDDGGEDGDLPAAADEDEEVGERVAI